MVILVCLPALVHAQVVNPNCDPSDPACPIDSGLMLLLAAGVGYGIKKMWNSRKKKLATSLI